MVGKIKQAEGQERPREAKLPGTCLFVDDIKTIRREGEKENPSGTLEMDGLGDVLCYSSYRILRNCSLQVTKYGLISTSSCIYCSYCTL